MLEHLKEHLKEQKVVILGMGNTLRGDDGAGSILAGRLKGKVPYLVYDVGSSPENYLGKVVKDRPQTVVIIDATDFRAKPGDFREIEAQDLKSANLFFTHNSSISLAINYLQANLKADIIILSIQPKSIALGDNLSPEVLAGLNKLEEWFCEANQKKG